MSSFFASLLHCAFAFLHPAVESRVAVLLQRRNHQLLPLIQPLRVKQPILAGN